METILAFMLRLRWNPLTFSFPQLIIREEVQTWSDNDNYIFYHLFLLYSIDFCLIPLDKSVCVSLPSAGRRIRGPPTLLPLP